MAKRQTGEVSGFCGVELKHVKIVLSFFPISTICALLIYVCKSLISAFVDYTANSSDSVVAIQINSGTPWSSESPSISIAVCPHDSSSFLEINSIGEPLTND